MSGKNEKTIIEAHTAIKIIFMINDFFKTKFIEQIAHNDNGP